MEETVTYTEAAASAAEGGGEALSIGMALVMGALAMTLIFVVTLLLPRIAASVDKALGNIKPHGADVPPAAAGENIYKVKDIYEGELNLEDNDKKE